jgi:hypothetical protein
LGKPEIFVLWFGKPTPFFPFWIKSIEKNDGIFRWKVFSDQKLTDSKYINSKVISRNDLKQAVESLTGGKIRIDIDSPNFSRKCCDYRLLLPLIFGNPSSSHWGWCDTDLIFGDISRTLSNSLEVAEVISTHPGRLSGPFSMLAPKHFKDFVIKNMQSISEKRYLNTDESSTWFQEAYSSSTNVFDDASVLQPTRGPDALKLKDTCAVWNNGQLSVKTSKGYASSFMVHFGKLKGHRRFWIDQDSVTTNTWYCNRNGIYKTNSLLLNLAKKLFNNML